VSDKNTERTLEKAGRQDQHRTAPRLGGTGEFLEERKGVGAKNSVGKESNQTEASPGGESESPTEGRRG